MRPDETTHLKGEAMRALKGRTSALRRRLVTLAALTAVISLSAVFVAPPAQAANTIEQQFNVAGSFGAVSTQTVTVNGNGYKLFYPTTLGANGYHHPIITWANGTSANPDNYTGLLNRLASWGYVVVASTSGTTGPGTLVVAGAQWMVAQNTTAGSIFNGKLDTTKVGAAGHSQGASGAINATTLSGGLIKSTLVFDLPNPVWVGAESAMNFSLITKPIMFMTGGNDWLISSASGNTGYYNQVAGAAAKASLNGAGHNTIQGTGGGYLGYTVAWFEYTLKGNTTARSAYVGSPPEINTNSAWANQAEKNLP
jgi:hypothetical protein